MTVAGYAPHCPLSEPDGTSGLTLRGQESGPSGTSSPMPCGLVKTERHLESHALRPNIKNERYRGFRPARPPPSQTAPQTSLPSLCGKAGATPSPRLAAKAAWHRSPPPRGKAAWHRSPTLRKSGAAPQVNLADKADRRRGRASRLVAKKLTCPRANYLTNALSSANGIANQARGVEGGPQQFASATRKAKPEGSRPETPPNTTPQRTVK